MSLTYPKDNVTREGIITNMCYTWDHAFGLLIDENEDDVFMKMQGYTKERQQALWNNMAQIYDNDIVPFHKLLDQ